MLSPSSTPPSGRTQGNVARVYARRGTGGAVSLGMYRMSSPTRCGDFSTIRSGLIFDGMGSYPRREKAEQKARERADTVPALDCQSCGALTPGERFRLRRPDRLRRLRRAESAEPSSIGAASASPAPQHMRELRGLPWSRGTSHGPRPTVSSGRLTRASATYLNRCVRSVPRRE